MNRIGIPKAKGGLPNAVALHRQRFRAELGAQYGLDRLPSAAEAALITAATAKVAGNQPKLTSALLTAGRACEAAIRAAKSKPAGRAIPIQRTAAPRPWQQRVTAECKEVQQQPPAVAGSLVDRLLAVGAR
jgi:hypothetical protein